MNYYDIKDMALSYADREDAEITSRIDNFLKIVEVRMNKELEMREMSARLRLRTSVAFEYYGLPADFRGIRNIKVRDSPTSTAEATLRYKNPEQMNAVSTNDDGIYYNIEGDQLRIKPKQDDKILEISYYQKVPALTSATASNTNWVSDSYPDCYIFGLLVEIHSFTKDKESAAMWDQRFKDSMNGMTSLDWATRWGGTPLEVRCG